MGDDAGPSDAFAAAVARAELQEISDRRAVRASGEFHGGLTNIEAARLVAEVLHRAAEKLGVPQDGDVDEMLRSILAAAQRGGLDPISYRILYFLAHIPKHEAAAPVS
jgi:hypothetical protein